MSTSFFPDLPGFTWGRKRATNWNTLIQTSASGLEARAALMLLARYEWTLKYNYLREAEAPEWDNNTPYYEVEAIEGSYRNSQGPLSTWLFRDQYQNSVTNQFIAYGDGTTTGFQAQVTLQGGNGQPYNEPVFALDTRGSYTYGPYTRPAALTPQAYINSSATSATFNTETGVITFGSAPASGATITATFSYAFRVRFSDDSIEMTNEFSIWNSLDGLKLLQTRV